MSPSPIKKWWRCSLKLERTVPLSKKRKGTQIPARNGFRPFSSKVQKAKVAVLLRDVVCLLALGSFQQHGWKCRRSDKLRRLEDSIVHQHLEAGCIWLVRPITSQLHYFVGQIRRKVPSTSKRRFSHCLFELLECSHSLFWPLKGLPFEHVG